jgi:ubiquinone/menaquinone biosynthesis C-methylase UbiE
MGFRESIKPRIQDWAMSAMDPLRPATIEAAQGDVLEVGFGTGRNLGLYGPSVKSLHVLDPMSAGPLRERIERRIARAPFPVEQHELRADRELPFEDGSFDSVVTTWTLCSIPDAESALQEMRRVLRPEGRYVFVEHGRAETESTAKWQDRVNPLWRKIADGCNLNRPIDRIVADNGFELVDLERFRAKGPGILARMYRGIARRAE